MAEGRNTGNVAGTIMDIFGDFTGVVVSERQKQADAKSELARQQEETSRLRIMTQGASANNMTYLYAGGALVGLAILLKILKVF